MRKNYLLLPLLLFFFIAGIKNANAQFALGDIAFTTYNSDGTADQFSFVLLRNVSVGESISFTDNGWFASGGFRSTEDTCTLTFSANYSCGTQIFISAAPFGARDQSMTSAGTLVGSPLALSATGDQLFAYDPANAPNATDSSGFVAAISMNGPWDADAISSNTSALPGVFTDGVNSMFISPEVDNAQYDCSVISAAPSPGLATAINNSANWNVDNVNNYTVPAPCTISCSAPPCNDPTVPVITLTPQTVCDGDSSLMTISGTLNDATQWVVYTGSCGGTQVAATSGTTVMVEISAPSIDFFVRGEGGCVTPGACGQTTGFGIQLDDPTFAYPNATYCTSDGPTTPTSTTPGGTYSSTPAGLSLTPSTGVIDPSTSTPNTYTVYYTTNGTCPATDSTTIIIVTCTGLNDLKAAEDYLIYPNPVQGILTIDLGDDAIQTDIIIRSIEGKEVMAQKLFNQISTIDLANLSPGIYIVQLINENEKREHRITKQ